MSRLIVITRGRPEPDERLMVCRVPVGPDSICGKVFRPGEERAWQRHVGLCAKAHRDDIEARRLANRMPVFDEQNWNPEVAEYLRGVGKKMIREGRLELKPNERVKNE